MVNGLEHLSWEERLRGLGLLSLEQSIVHAYNTWWRGVKKTVPDFSKRKGNSQQHKLEILETLFKHIKFLFQGWSNTGIGSPESLWSFHPWRYSKSSWASPCPTCCIFPFGGGGTRLDCLQQVPSSHILSMKHWLLEKWVTDKPLTKDLANRIFH